METTGSLSVHRTSLHVLKLRRWILDNRVDLGQFFPDVDYCAKYSTMTLSVSIMTGKYERTSINVCCYLITYAGIFFNPRGVMWLKIENVEWPASDSSCVYLMSFYLVNEFITDQKLKPKEKSADRRWKILSYENSNMTRINEKRRTLKISLCQGTAVHRRISPLFWISYEVGERHFH